MSFNGSFVGIQGAGSGSQTTVGEERVDSTLDWKREF